MNRSKERNKRHVIEMDDRLEYILNLINYDTDSDNIFQDFELYSEVLKILEEIEELWQLYINNSKVIESIFHSYIGIIDVVKKSKEGANYDFIIWVDNYSRHTFNEGKWNTAFRRFQKFVEN